jgi:hypothetical protein
MRLTRETEQLPCGYVLFFYGGVEDVLISDEADHSVIVDPCIIALAIVEPFVVGCRVNCFRDDPKPEYFVLDTASHKLS